MLQAVSLLFLSVSVVTTDSYAAMMLATGALSYALLGTRLDANEAGGGGGGPGGRPRAAGSSRGA